MYEDWKTGIGRSPNSIRLDARNPRLHDVPINVSARELLDLHLTQYQKPIRDLAKSIVEKGYFPVEDIILIEESNKLTVVEGNCRISACKLLVNSNLATNSSDKKYFASLSKRLTESAKNSFKKVPCSIAPSREQAHILIESRHTSSPINPWSPYAQGNFYRTLLGEGRTVQDLAEEFSRSVSEIRNTIRIASASDLIMHLPNAEKLLGSNSQDVKKIGAAAAIIMRLLQSEEAREYFGQKVTVSDDGTLECALPPDDFIGIVSSLAQDALVNKDSDGKPIINTRILNSAKDMKRYLKDTYSGHKPGGNEKGKFNSKDYIEKAKLGDEAESTVNTNDQENAAETEKKSGGRKNDQWLVKRSIDAKIKNEKVCGLIAEAKKVKWAAAPMTSGLLLRAIIECALKARFKELDIWDIAFEKKPLVGLDDLITKTFEYKEVLNDEHLRAGLKSDYHYLKKKGRFKLVLDFIQHNEQHILIGDDVEEIRARTEPLIRHLVETLPSRK